MHTKRIVNGSRKRNRILAFAVTFLILMGMSFPASVMANDENVVPPVVIAEDPDMSGETGEFMETPEEIDGIEALADPHVMINRESTAAGLGNQSILVGEVYDNIIVAISGATIDTVEWSSSEPAVFTVTKNGERASIKGIKEGFGRLKVSVRTTDGTTLTDEANITVYTDVDPNVRGVTNASTDGYRGASTISTFRGTVASGQGLTITYKSGSYYLVVYDESFPDESGGDYSSAWVLKSKVDIPVTGVSMGSQYTEAAIGGSAQLSATVSPDLATNKSLTWTSGSTSVATINSSGKATGVKEGVAQIKVAPVSGSGSDTAKVTVYKKIDNVKGVAKQNVQTWHSGDGTSSAGTLSGSAGVTISGQCGDYWRIGTNLYVAKSVINIPVTAVVLNVSNAHLNVGESMKLTATVEPDIATNKTITWDKIPAGSAIVDAYGKVTAKRVGKIKINASAVDGNKTATCVITVALASKDAASFIKGTKVTGKYIYKFNNSTASFYKAKKGNYYMSQADKIKLTNKVWNSYKSNVNSMDTKFSTKNALYKNINKKLKKKWAGSCYGMSLSVALNRVGQINMRTYTKTKKGTGRQLNQIDYPKNNKKVMSAVNYYQESQYYFRSGKIYSYWKYTTFEDFDVDSWNSGLKKIVTLGKQKKLQSFGYSGYNPTDGSFGHQILIKKYDKKVAVKIDNKATKCYRLSAYDPSYPGSAMYVYISTDYTKIRISNKEHNYGTIYSVDTTTNFSDFTCIDIDN